MNGIKLIVFIVGKGRGNELVRRSNAEGLPFSLILHGRGTADKEVLNTLGIDGQEKDVVLISCESGRAAELLDKLSGDMGIEKSGCGVAFTIPLSAAVSQLGSCELLMGRTGEVPSESERRSRRNGRV